MIYDLSLLLSEVNLEIFCLAGEEFLLLYLLAIKLLIGFLFSESFGKRVLRIKGFGWRVEILYVLTSLALFNGPVVANYFLVSSFKFSLDLSFY